MTGFTVSDEDVEACSHEASSYSVGLTSPTDGSNPELVFALDDDETSIALFLDKHGALDLLGALTEQMRKMGWLS